jgi:putative glutathione S-transferase
MLVAAEDRAMGMLIDGVWTTKWYEPDEAGNFVRSESQFRERVTADGSSGFPAVAGRYHLYVAWACPWAHRTVIMRHLQGLGQVISMSVVDPFMGDDGWAFRDDPECTHDHVNGARFLREIYVIADRQYTGRVTVPVLWDRERRTIVSNESREILRMLDHEFTALAATPVDLCPAPLRTLVDATIDEIYEPINNGVYRAGFATKQSAHERAVRELFHALDHWDRVLGDQRYLCGEALTEADICMFTTLLRFDAVYHGHFKCNLRRITDYPNLSGYLRALYQRPGIAELCKFDQIKRHYYGSHADINPTRIVPLGPIQDLGAPHDRDRFG